MFDLETGEKLMEFETMTRARDHVGGKPNQGYISNCCNGKHKSAYGYGWKYSKEQ